MPQIAQGSEEPIEGGRAMRVTRVSKFTGETHVRDLPITPQQLALWRSGELIQNAFPQLDNAGREFLITGTTQEEWDDAFAAEDDPPD